MDNPVSRWGRIVLLILATLRMTRFVTSDYLGEWTLVRRAKAWAVFHDTQDGNPPPIGIEEGVDLHSGGWRSKLVSGLDCPFCVGFWIGALVLLIEWATRLPGLRWARPLWTAVLAVFALNEVVGHVSSRIDA